MTHERPTSPAPPSQHIGGSSQKDRTNEVRPTAAADSSAASDFVVGKLDHERPKLEWSLTGGSAGPKAESNVHLVEHRAGHA